VKTHWKKTFNKDYLGSHDLDNGEGSYSDITVTIDRVEMKTINDPNGNKEAVRIAYFREKVKPMILNVGACETIETFAGSRYIEDWSGQAISVFVDTNAKLFGGQRGAACRIRTVAPRTEFPDLTKDHERYPELVAAYKDKGADALAGARRKYTISAETEAQIIEAASEAEA